jgi:multidrug efflux system outer membrane protein
MFGQARPAADRPFAWRAGKAALIVAITFALGGCALTPHPLTDEQRAAEVHADLAGIFEDQKPLHGPLTLHQAFARALAYNLDNRVKLMEIAVANNDLDISKYDMLPRLMANAGYTWRSNVDASSSQSVLTGQQSLEPSTSTDRELRLADLTLSWNILDFGVSYFTARQNANRVLVAEEQRRRVMANLLQDVRRAFWRAAAAQMLDRQVRDAIASAESGLSTSRRLESEALRSPVDVLRYQRTLLDLVRQLELTQRELTAAKVELAALINLPLGRRFTLAVPAMRIDRTRLPVRAMEELALLRNPDLLEASYKSRISADESRKLLLRLVPGVNLTYGPNYDSDSFLVNHTWYAAAARLSGNLVGLVQLPAQMQRADDVALLELRRRQALGMAVIARVHVSYEQYLAAANVYRWASQLAEVDRQLYQQISNRAETDAQGQLERISAQTGAVSSELLRYRSFAEAQAALGRLYAALGVDTVNEDEYLTPNAKILRHALHAAQERAKAADGKQAADKAAANAAAGADGEAAKTAGAAPAQPPAAEVAQEPQAAPDAQGRPSPL